MSVGHTITGLAALGLSAQLLITSILPEPQPIVVHSLDYKDGVVYQDRTVTTDGPFFYATWAAEVIYASTGDTVRGCAGGGSWNYEPGRIVADMSLDRWTNTDNCVLDAGTYQLVASWFWGADQEVHKSEVFEVTE